MTDPTLASLLADLEAERAELDVTIAHLRRRAGLTPASEGGTGPAANGGSRDLTAGRDTAVIVGRVRSDEFFRLSIADAITKYLGIMKQPQNPMAIVNGLKAGGVLTNAKNFYANVNTELKRIKARGLVVNTPSGWGLAEWYPRGAKQAEPAKPKKKGRRRSGATRALPGPSAAPFKATATPELTKHRNAGGDAYHRFISERRKAGRTLAEANQDWKSRKA